MQSHRRSSLDSPVQLRLSRRCQSLGAGCSFHSSRGEIAPRTIMNLKAGLHQARYRHHATSVQVVRMAESHPLTSYCDAFGPPLQPFTTVFRLNSVCLALTCHPHIECSTTQPPLVQFQNWYHSLRLLRGVAESHSDGNVTDTLRCCSITCLSTLRSYIGRGLS